MKKFLLCCLLLCLLPIVALAAEAPVELGEDLYGFRIKIDGVVYTLPMSAETLEAQGWSFDGDEGEELDPGQYSYSERFEKGDGYIYANFVNFDIDTLPFLENPIGEVTAEADYVGEGVEVELPGGAKLGVTTEEEARSLYGEPSDIYEGDTRHSLTYELDSYQDIVLDFDLEAGSVLSEIAVRNFAAAEEPDYSKVSPDAPAYVADYVAPTELGDDFTSFNVSYEGKVYHIPAPFTEFAAEGWTILDGEDVVVPARDTAFLSLRKENATLDTMLYNPGKTATLAKYCLVLVVKSDDYDAKFDLALPLGITIGTGEEEMKTLLAEIEPPLELTGENDGYYRQYTYEIEYGQSIEIMVDTETSTIDGISVENDVYGEAEVEEAEEE